MTGLASNARGAPRSARAVMASRDHLADDVDFFPTPPWGARAGADLIKRLDPDARSVWECAAGAGHAVHGLRDYFPVVHESDAYDYGRGVRLHDFTDRSRRTPFAADWIVTNPPFALTQVFIRQAWRHARRGLAMLMRLAMLEGQERYRLFYGDVPLTAVAPFAERLPMHKGRYDPDGVTATAYAWFIWLKPVLRPERFMVRLDGRLWPATIPIAPGAEARFTRPSDAAFAVRP